MKAVKFESTRGINQINCSKHFFCMQMLEKLSADNYKINIHVPVLGTFEHFELLNYSSPLSRPLANLITNAEYNVSILYDRRESPKEVEDELDRIFEIIDGDMDVIIKDFSRPILQKHEGNSFNVVFIHSNESLELFFSIVNSDKFTSQSFFFIVIPASFKIFINLETLFERFLNYGVPYVYTLTVAPNDEDAILHTYYPFSANKCSDSTPVIANYYTAKYENWTEADFFQFKVQKMFGCPLRVATFHFNPFMILKEDEDGKISVDGIEGSLLNVLSERMNFTIEIITSNDRWGIIFENGTTTGNVQMILNRTADISLGYFSVHDKRQKLMSSTSVYLISNLIWAVPPGEPYSPLEILLKPFEKSLWNWFFIVLISAFVIIRVLRMFPKKVQYFVFGRNVRHPVLNVVNIMLGGSLPKLPVRNFARTIMMLFMFYCFIMNNAYKGGLFQFMKSDQTKPPLSTTTQLYNKNFRFYSIPDGKIFLNETPKILDKTIFLNNPEEYDEGLKHLRDPKFKRALMITQEKLAFENIKNSPDVYYHRANDVIFRQHLVIYMNKFTIFEWSFEDIILQLVSGGFMDAWIKKFTDTDILKDRVEERELALTLDQLMGAFQLLGVGLFISFTVLVFENCLFNIKKCLKSNSDQFCENCEMK
ncbi:CLUMA_CG001079, isoform A [Clunio marinus]|uniref:CLUMA_CG001079, isoform A n=1 Tax=Clunio marinus TaxID=568069 RepID=A0A1J1HH03_9DIPT|nr:CLUMA_CG001079, isoform A [Clunio marinus]